MKPTSDLTVVNTLGGALGHYTRALVDNLESAGATCTVISIEEPSRSGESALRWLTAYVKVLRRARRTGGRVLVTWPVLGYLDLLLLTAMLGSRGSIVLHDPLPLVDARGYDRYSRAMASAASSVEVIVHSTQALDAVHPASLRRRATLIEHPMFAPERPTSAESEGGRVVRVLGQYKPDRDVDALRALGSELVNTRLEIVGRRWPQVEGWDVKDEFVSEVELEHLMGSSDVVLVPYRRFYQSGIAIRALEKGTAVVGPSATSMADLLGDTALLVEDGDWAESVRFALTDEGRDTTYEAATAWHRRAVEGWARWWTSSRASV